MDNFPDGFVVVTAAEVYHEVRATHEEVRSLTTKFDEWRTSVQEKITDQENRIRAIERRIWMGAGVTLVLSAALSVLAPLLLHG